MKPATQSTARVIEYLWLIVCLPAILAPVFAGPPPQGLARLVAENELQNEAARSHYAYRQTMVFDEIEPRGGRYREVREIIFSPGGLRDEAVTGAPHDSLKRLRLTKEDFEILRDIMPVMLVPEMLPRYIVRYRGEETVDGTPCWVLELTPRQLFQDFRMFDGMVWVHQSEMMIIRTHGRAVPAIRTSKHENLFPTFTTVRSKIDGKHWFPALTHADDVLEFRTGGQRVRMEIRYASYQRFDASSTITFPREEK